MNVVVCDPYERSLDTCAVQDGIFGCYDLIRCHYIKLAAVTLGADDYLVITNEKPGDGSFEIAGRRFAGRAVLARIAGPTRLDWKEPGDVRPFVDWS